MRFFFWTALACGLVLSGEGLAAERTGPLATYLAEKDDSYQWSEKRSGQLGATRYTELRLVSQKWRDVTWKHQMFILRPSTAKDDVKHALLLISGGSWRAELEGETDSKLPSDSQIYALLAERLKTPVAILMQVPHQPLFNDLVEDQAIAYTFDKFIQSGDSNWPLLLPMVKSAVKGMDAVQQFAAKTWSMDIKTFTVSGASKRGWTTWLTGASDDRVTAIAPMVIDMLNMTPQLKHQSQVWGDLSYKINDYTRLGLPDKLQTEQGQQLQRIVDPYHYRQALKQPKLIIIGTNDHYWPVDALNIYWKDLVGPKYILYVPNNRHGLQDYGRVIGGVYALHQHAARGASLPNLQWSFRKNGRGVVLQMASDIKPESVKMWMATSSKRDFRDAKWQWQPSQEKDANFSYEMTYPQQGYAAMFGEAAFKMDDVTYQLSTNLRVFGENGDGATAD